MKKILTLVIIGFLMLNINNAKSQSLFSSDFENWTVNDSLPFDWGGLQTNFNGDSIIHYTDNAHSPTHACRLKNRSTSHKRLTTQALSITASTTYTINFWVRGHGSIRTGLYDGNSSGNIYNSYIAVNSNTWTQQTQTIAADSTSTVAEFIISVKQTFADLDDIQIDDVSIDTGGTTSSVTIYQIQFTTASNGDSPYNGQVVSTSGIVTAKHNKGYFIQDEAGIWEGIYVFDSTHAANLNIGDSVVLQGSVTEYYGYTEIKNVSSFTVVSTGHTPPAAWSVTTADVNTEQYESVLVKVTDATCVDANAGYGMWTVNDGTDTCKIHNLLYTFTPTLNTHYDIKGPVYYSYNEYRIEPRNAGDVQIHGGINEFEQNAVNIYPNPVANSLGIYNMDGIQMVKISDILGETIENIKISGSHTEINVSALPAGIYFITFIDQSNIKGTRKFVKI